MGKTYRKEKSFGNRKPRLNSHRDLPDFMEDFADEEEDFYYAKLHPEEQNVERPEDESSGQTDKGQR
jgi:hypothetical protein